MTLIFELTMGITCIAMVLYMFKMLNIVVTDRRAGITLYYNTLNAFRTGVLIKKAQERGVDLVYPEEMSDEELVDKIDEEVEEDMNRLRD